MSENTIYDLIQEKRRLLQRVRSFRGSGSQTFWDDVKPIYEAIWNLNGEIRSLRGLPLNNRAWRAEKRSHEPTLEHLRTVLEYDPETGRFKWLVSRQSRHGISPGDIAGSFKCDSKNGRHDGGYIQIVVDQHQYRAHRLAWWFMTGTPAPKG